MGNVVDLFYKSLKYTMDIRNIKKIIAPFVESE